MDPGDWTLLPLGGGDQPETASIVDGKLRLQATALTLNWSYVKYTAMAGVLKTTSGDVVPPHTWPKP